MKEYIVFCEECREEVDYYTKKIKNYQIIKDKKYEYGANISYCKNCDSNVYVPHLEDENLKNLYDDFREKNNIISLEKVRDIPKKYNIGKLPLATLLGWGLQTFKRYYDGDVPSKQYSEILEKIYNDPSYFLSLLENKKDNLKSEKAYKKSKEATKKLLCNSTNSKLFEIEKYILSKKVRITPLSLQKLLYYIQGFSYAFLNKYLFLENCEAWVRGPVYRKIYDKYNKKYYCLDEIKNSKESNDFLITEEEKSIIDNVLRYAGCYDGEILEDFTHKETPWIKTRGNLRPEEHSNEIIRKELIKEYFCSVKNKYNMLSPINIKDYFWYMFNQTQ